MDETFKNQLWTILKKNAPTSVGWSHYDLANFTEVNDPDIWKEFLQLREVEDWLNEERVLLRKTELARLSTDLDSHSVGQAQMLNAMAKLTENDLKNKQTGPAFIYTYIPLNKEQIKAPNVQVLAQDIFYDDNSKVPKQMKPEFTIDEKEPDFN